MIIGVLIRVILQLCRRRGLRVPDPSRMRLRRPRLGLTDQLIDRLADHADELFPQRQPGKRNNARGI